jgi:hypothetical protein
MNSLPHFFLSVGDNTCSSGKIFGTGLYDRLCKDGHVNVTALNDIYVLIGNVIKILLSFVGLLSVIFIVVGGIFYILSTGEPARIQRAKSIITNAIVGLIISLVAFAGVTFIAAAFS